MRTVMRDSIAASISECVTGSQAPTYAICRPGSSPNRSRNVRQSASARHGYSRSVSAFDDRHRCVLGELEQVSVPIRANRDRIAVRREHACGVGDRVALPEPELGRLEHDRKSTQPIDGDLERHAAARRGRLEEAGDGAPLERAAPCQRMPLHDPCEVEQRVELARRKIVDPERHCGIDAVRVVAVIAIDPGSVQVRRASPALEPRRDGSAKSP
jgi:hypothetical protein